MDSASGGQGALLKNRPLDPHKTFVEALRASQFQNERGDIIPATNSSHIKITSLLLYRIPISRNNSPIPIHDRPYH